MTSTTPARVSNKNRRNDAAGGPEAHRVRVRSRRLGAGTGPGTRERPARLTIPRRCSPSMTRQARPSIVDAARYALVLFLSLNTVSAGHAEDPAFPDAAQIGASLKVD